MTRARILLTSSLIVLLAACAAPPPPVVVPEGEDRFVVDPRLGEESAPPGTNERFEIAWRHLLAGNEAEAGRLLAELRRRNPSYRPAQLAEVAIDLRAGRHAEARQKLAAIPKDNYTAAEIYDAEIAYREGRLAEALERYRAVAARGDAPSIAITRLAQLEDARFAELYASSRDAEDAEAIRLLREALLLRPGDVEARVALGLRLVAQKHFDEARSEITPVLDVAADRPGVQEILAEIAAGRGQYQDAIVRYERLVRRSPEARYVTRLEEIKRRWNAANMPPQYSQAVESPAITRGELAVLLYWTVPAVRFAQNLATPPIATDVIELEGRDEMIRAIAIGLYEVDPVTRRAHPSRPVTASRLSAHLSRVLLLRGARCAQGLTQEGVLEGCGVTDPLRRFAPDETVPGAAALEMLEQIAKAFQ